jgi:hypothetical protein
MSKLQDLQDDLAGLLGREVDVVDRRGIEKSENWIRRRQILTISQPANRQEFDRNQE